MGERERRGDNDDDCGRGGCIVVVVIKQRGQRLGGKGGRGTTLMTMAGGEIVSSSLSLSSSLLSFQGHNTHVAVGQESCGRHAVAHCIVEVALEGRRRRRGACWCWRGIQHNFVNWARKKMIIKLIDFILIFTPTPNLIFPKTTVSPFPRSPPPVQSPHLLSLLCCARVLFGELLCFVVDFWPPKSTTYFFLSSIFID